MRVSKTAPMAFMAFEFFEGEHENQRLTALAELLSAEVSVQTGKEFVVHADMNAKQRAAAWKERLKADRPPPTFYLPVITPSYVRSAFCREELSEFLKFEKGQRRKDLVLPIYYVDVPSLRESGDALARTLVQRQFIDWRELRYEPLTSPQIHKTVSQVALVIRGALSGGKTAAARKQIRREEHFKSAHPPSPKTDFPTRIVDQSGRGHFLTLSEAILGANPGDRVLIRPGIYKEGVVVDKPLEIVGEGAPGEVVVAARGKDTLLFRTNMGRVANLTIRQEGGTGDWHGVNIVQGRLEVEDCFVTSKGATCVAIQSGADPRLRGNQIRGGRRGGIHVYNAGLGTIEDNEISENSGAGVIIESGGDPTLRRNFIYKNKGDGVFIQKSAQGTLEDNEIAHNTGSGVRIETDSAPVLRRNTIKGNRQHAILVQKGGGGIVEDNDLRGNTRGALKASADSSPSLRRARNQGAEDTPE